MLSLNTFACKFRFSNQSIFVVQNMIYIILQYEHGCKQKFFSRKYKFDQNRQFYATLRQRHSCIETRNAIRKIPEFIFLNYVNGITIRFPNRTWYILQVYNTRYSELQLVTMILTIRNSMSLISKDIIYCSTFFFLITRIF